MTVAAVMQPTYLPWVGYFDLMDQVDVFVLLDDVAFSRQSWQQRNRVRTASGLTWLTIPVRRENPGSLQIRDVQIADPKFADKHWRTIEQAYARCPFFCGYRDSLREIFVGSEPWQSLAALNIRLIEWLAAAIGIQTPLLVASTLECGGRRGEHVAELCVATNATQYRSPPGAETYLREDAKCFVDRRLELSLHEYRHPVYPQLHTPFLPHACALDLLFNRGSDALAVLREGRRPARRIDLQEGVPA